MWGHLLPASTVTIETGESIDLGSSTTKGPFSHLFLPEYPIPPAARAKLVTSA